MPQEMGESRDSWGMNVMKMAEDFANNMKHEDKPFYIVYACKPDQNKPGVFRQTLKAYHSKPPLILGILVWYVDHPNGVFRFESDLSSPPDIPLDPSLLSIDSNDSFASVASKGEKLKVLVS
jgi:hypothetical protein